MFQEDYHPQTPNSNCNNLNISSSKPKFLQIQPIFTMGEKKKKKEEKENGGGLTVVLKTDFHCDGCASKVMKFLRSYDGVDTVTIEGEKITVVGKVDPAELREKVEHKAHTKVELISPQPKKDGADKENAGGKEKESKDNGKKEKKKEDEKKSEDKSDQKLKIKEPPLTTAVFKLSLHCDGCVQKIYKIVTKSKGYEDIKIDAQKDLVTVTGAMDMKALAEVLKKQLKREVEIAPAKKEGEKKEKDGGEEKVKTGGGGGGNGSEENVQGNKIQAFQPGYPYPYPYPDQFLYNPYSTQYHAPQMFSDENPNACSVM